MATKRIQWPKGAFSLKDLYTANLQFHEITLRVQLSLEIEHGTIEELGTIRTKKGKVIRRYRTVKKGR